MCWNPDIFGYHISIRLGYALNLDGSHIIYGFLHGYLMIQFWMRDQRRMRKALRCKRYMMKALITISGRM